MKYNNCFVIIFSISIIVSISYINACDVVGSRACGYRPLKKTAETKPIEYCFESRVYLQCVYKNYNGCENVEKYKEAMKSIMKGIRKYVADLSTFCSGKIEDFQINITLNSANKSETIRSVRNPAPNNIVISSKNGIHGSSPVKPIVNNDICQVKVINDLCQPLTIHVKFNPTWNIIKQHGWCQQALAYFRCLKSMLDKCSQQEIQNQFQQLEHYLEFQININCPGGINGCARHSTDARCTIGLLQSNSNVTRFYFSYFFFQSVFEMLLILLLV